MGIASLKIEGRLRKPDYIRNAVAAYRMLLDTEGAPDRKLLGEARKILSSTYGRKWSHGFYSAQSAKGLIKHDAQGAAGLLCGRVGFTDEKGFGFKTAHRLYLGDRLRVQPANGDEGPAMTLTRMSVDGRQSMKATQGQDCFIFCDKEIPFNGLVYKIGENYDEMQGKLASLPELRSALDLHIELNQTEMQVEILNADSPVWKQPILAQPAKTRPLVPERVVMEFTASCSEELRAGSIRVDIDGEYFVPASELKRVRREFWDWVLANLDQSSIFNSNVMAMERFRKDYLAIRKTDIDAAQLPETIVMGPNTRLPGKRSAIKAYPISDMNRMTDEVILPSFCPEPYLNSLRRMIQDAYERKIRRFRVTGLFALDLLKEYADIQVCTGFPLPICNSMAIQELVDFGVNKIQGWVELEQDALLALVSKSVLPVEIYRYGRPPLLSTRAYIPVKDEIKDARDNYFVVKEDRRTHIANVYPKNVFSIPRLPGTADYYDLSNANWGAREIEDFNFRNALM